VNPDKTPGSVDWGQRSINSAASRGDLLVHPRCRHTLRMLRHWKGTTRGDDGEMAHIADALRYVLIGALGSQHEYATLRLT
jgi:hypothetical protein